MTTPQTLSLDGEWLLRALPPGAPELVVQGSPERAVGPTCPAPVPGHVPEALLRHGGPPELAELAPRPEEADPWRRIAGCEWLYERAFRLPDSMAEARVHLRFEAIDGRAEVLLDGARLGTHDARFLPAEWDVTGRVRPGTDHWLAVRLSPSADAATTGWGGGRPLVPGLPGSVSLRATGAARFLSIAPHTNLARDRGEAALSLVCEFEATAPLSVAVVAEITLDGLPVVDVENPITLRGRGTTLVQSAVLPRPQLWWPHGAGRQPLYQARLSLFDAEDRLLDQRSIAFGVREIAPLLCPATGPDELPDRLEVNGREVPLWGWIWAPLDLFWGTVSAERYERALRLARAAAPPGVATLLRVSGDGILETDRFYRLCDRLGLFVWQEFPLAAGDARATPSVEGLRARAEAAIALRRSHPSLLAWSATAQESAVFRALREAVEMEDPQRLWLAAPAGSARGTLALAPDEDPLEALRSEAGPPAEPAVVLRAAELLRAEALQRALEARRRAKSTPEEARCAPLAFLGTLPGILSPRGAGPALQDESLPAAGTAVSGGDAADGRPGPAWYAIRRAGAPLHVSAEAPGRLPATAPLFAAEVWIHNDGPERPLLNVVARIVDLGGRELYQENLAAEAPAGRSEPVGDIAWRFPPGFAGPFLLLLEVVDDEGDVLARNAGWHARGPEPAFAALLSPPPARLRARHTPEGVRVENVGEAVALAVSIEPERGWAEDSFFPLVPGAAREVRVEEGGGAVCIRAWNAPEIELPEEEPNASGEGPEGGAR